jgi:hypothetical protein
MKDEHPDLDQFQRAYKAAVEEWITAIRKEESLASANHSLAEIDHWEQAEDEEEAARGKVRAAKAEYEAALREKFFGF